MAGTDAALNDRIFARLLFDCMFPAALAQSLREQGFDVVEARQFPLRIQQNDHALLEIAARERRVVITCNYRDPKSNFCVIHEESLRSGKSHSGIVLVSQFLVDNHNTRWVVRRRLLDLFNSRSWEEFQDQLLWLP